MTKDQIAAMVKEEVAAMAEKAGGTSMKTWNSDLHRILQKRIVRKLIGAEAFEAIKADLDEALSFQGLGGNWSAFLGWARREKLVAPATAAEKPYEDLM